jgi:hypothetical protein
MHTQICFNFLKVGTQALSAIISSNVGMKNGPAGEAATVAAAGD